MKTKNTLLALGLFLTGCVAPSSPAPTPSVLPDQASDPGIITPVTITTVEAPIATPTPSSSPVVVPSPVASPSPTPSPTQVTPTPSPTPTPTVIPAPQPPTLSVPNKSLSEASPFSYQLVGNSPQNHALSYSCVSNCPTGMTVSTAGLVSWTPSYGQAGSYSPRFEVSDGSLTNDSIPTWTVAHTNRAPTINPVSAQMIHPTQAMAIVPTGSDPDGDTLTFSAVGVLPTNASFSNGQLLFTPSTAQDSQQFQFTLKVSDPSGSSAQTSFTVTVNDVAPQMAAIPNQAVTQGNSMSYTVTATDPNSYAVNVSTSILPSGATYNAQTGAFSYTPVCGAGVAGTKSITFTADDGHMTNTQTMQIAVTAGPCGVPSWNNSATLSGATMNISGAGEMGYAQQDLIYKLYRQYSCKPASGNNTWPNYTSPLGTTFTPMSNTSWSNYLAISTSANNDYTTWYRYFAFKATDAYGQVAYKMVKVSVYVSMSTGNPVYTILSSMGLPNVTNPDPYAYCGSITDTQLVWNY